MICQQTLSFLGIGILSSLLVISCSDTANTPFNNSIQEIPSTQLTISAAASLKNAMEDIKILYEEENPETEITYNFGSSGSLQRQIEQGAPVDVFISAAVDKMDALETQGFILPDTRQDLLKNAMVLITPSNPQASLKVADFTDLTTQAVTKIALGEPNSVPAGKYAQEVLTSFQLADQVNTKAVYGKDVRQVLNYVATGNVDAGIVYRTDAEVSGSVNIITTAPENTHSPVIYPLAIVQDSDNPEAAMELIAFLKTPTAQTVFQEYGFTPITNDK